MYIEHKIEAFRTHDSFHKANIWQEINLLVSALKIGGNIFAINGPDPFSIVTGTSIHGLIIGIDDGLKKGIFSPVSKDFSNPHDVAVSEDGSTIYVVELNPFLVWKLTDAGEMTSQEQNQGHRNRQRNKNLFRRIMDFLTG